MNDQRFLKRIDFKGDLSTLLSEVCKDYGVGVYKDHLIVPVGYEDLNIVIETDQGKYFAKIFASFRSSEDCRRYIDIVRNILQSEVSSPSLYQNSINNLEEIVIDGSVVRVCLMQYIDGQTLYQEKENLTQAEGIYLIEQAAKINGINYKPDFVYDSWAISNFPAEFEKKKDILANEDREAIAPIVEGFLRLSVNLLPHALVHGDIISTNVMRNREGKLYIIDFSVANWYPRIQELAVLLCDIFFDQKSSASMMDKYNWAVTEYQKHIPLTSDELKSLPVFVRAAHAMHIIGSSFEKSQGNTEEENNSWLLLGRRGLELTFAQK